MRTVAREQDFTAALEGAVREAKAAFGDGRVLLEKLIARPRHIEVQVFADAHGSVVHLYERDCTLQRRHQKVIEETPAPGMSEGLRAKITAAAVACATAVGYEGAGTVEFLVEGGALAPDAPWYFIEMNTRLQVEHPVTELITGLDLVEWQFRVAAGEPLPLRQDQIPCAGHAIEARLYAEHPATEFLPSTGRLAALELPHSPGLRVDSGVRAGDEVTPFYDPMLAKIIAHADRRETALDRLCAALEATVVAGPRTNAAFLHALLRDPHVRRAEVDTGLIGRELARLTRAAIDPTALAAGVRRLILEKAPGPRTSPPAAGISWPWNAADAFQLGGERAIEVPVLVDGTQRTFRVSWPRARASSPVVQLAGAPAEAHGEPPDHHCRFVRDGDRLYVLCDLLQAELSWPEHAAAPDAGEDSDGAVRAPINGRVAKVFLRPGAEVAKGDRIAVVEAMKMEHVLHAPRPGRIERLAVREGQQVAQGALIATIAEAPAA
jgi:3-methylcrotonyl-CoA carboxylase alpha subunit